MGIADYPKTIEKKDQYTAGDIAVLYGVAHRTACKMIDSGVLSGFKVPGGQERRVLHSAVMRHVAANPQYKYVLDKIIG